MISKWKVAAIVITTVAKVAFVSPAFAQSFDLEIGTGNVLMLNHQASFLQYRRASLFAGFQSL
jgi:hypothetical protein